MLRKLDQLSRRNSILFIGVVRMRADRAVNIGKLRGNGQQRIKTPHPRRNSDDASDPRRGSSRDDALEIVGEIWKVEVAMAIDKHELEPFRPPLRCNAERPARMAEAGCPI